MGVISLDDILDRALRREDVSDDVLKGFIMSELKSVNYIPPSAEDEYMDAVWKEYEKMRDRKTEPSEEDYHGIPRREIDWSPTIDYETCDSCGLCVRFCHRGVFNFDGDRVIVANPDSCIVGCTGCVSECERGAISFPSMKELIERLKKLRKEYYSQG